MVRLVTTIDDPELASLIRKNAEFCVYGVYIYVSARKLYAVVNGRVYVFERPPIKNVLREISEVLVHVRNYEH